MFRVQMYCKIAWNLVQEVQEDSAQAFGFVLVRTWKFVEVIFVTRPVASNLIASYAHWLGWRTATWFQIVHVILWLITCFFVLATIRAWLGQCKVCACAWALCLKHIDHLSGLSDCDDFLVNSLNSGLKLACFPSRNTNVIYKRTLDISWVLVSEKIAWGIACKIHLAWHESRLLHAGRFLGTSVVLLWWKEPCCELVFRCSFAVAWLALSLPVTNIGSGAVCSRDQLHRDHHRGHLPGVVLLLHCVLGGDRPGWLIEVARGNHGSTAQEGSGLAQRPACCPKRWMRIGLNPVWWRKMWLPAARSLRAR